LIKNYEEESNYEESKANCCSLGDQNKLCLCNHSLYQIRPYTFIILMAIQPFFELIAVSYLPNYELEQIVNHIEDVLNKPIIEVLVR
jgi:hypothetical protein